MILQVKNLTMKFGPKTVFQNLCFNLQEGSMTALLGPNGTGKTTLINILMGLLVPTSGSFKFSPNIKLGYVPQFRNIDKDYPLSIKAFIKLNSGSLKRREVRKKAKKVLGETNLLEIQNLRMGEASGGQKQRAYLAQALMGEPNMIILDEATANLDPGVKEELMQLIKSINEANKITVLFVTHDIELASKYMKDYLYLNHGSVKQGKIVNFNENYEQ